MVLSFPSSDGRPVGPFERGNAKLKRYLEKVADLVHALGGIRCEVLVIDFMHRTAQNSKRLTGVLQSFAPY
jgi:hypothetical protein